MLWVEQTGNMVEDCLVNSLLVGNVDPFTHSLYLCLVHASAPAHHFDTTLLQECDLTTRRSQFVTTLPTWNQNDPHFFLQNPVLQTERWSWLLAPSDVATPLWFPPSSRPGFVLVLLHLLLHQCVLERVTGGELVNLKIETVVTESELSSDCRN